MSEYPQTAARGMVSRVAREHPTLVFTVGYVALTLLGLVYSGFLFLLFRINIIEYSETSDFLLAAVRTPLVIILAILPALVVLLGGKVIRWARAKYPRYDARYKRYESKWWGRPNLRGPLWTLFAIVYAILFAQLYAIRVGKTIKEGGGKKVRVEIAGKPPDTETPALIGTTGSFIFLYYKSVNETKIVPFDAVTSITVAGKKRPAPR